MGINRVHGSAQFAQIANSALRDSRLSFRARGILAMVLSHSAEWEAGRDWISNQTETEGRQAVQTALNELTEFGYRAVSKRNVQGQIVNVVDWYHQPLTDRFLGGQDAVGNRTPLQNTKNNTPADAGASATAKAMTDAADFATWYQKYPRKEAPKKARAAYDKAIKDGATAADLMAGLDRQAAVWVAENTEKKFIPHPATWLNQGRWMNDYGLEASEKPAVDISKNPNVCQDCLTFVAGKDQHLCVALGEPYIRIHAEAGDGRAA